MRGSLCVSCINDAEARIFSVTQMPVKQVSKEVLLINII